MNKQAQGEDKLAGAAPAKPLDDADPPPDGRERAESGALYRQVAAAIRQQIRAGELRPGDLLPSESALMRRFGVSRGTVRHGLATLRADGTITGSRGRPLEVRGPHLTQPLSELFSFTAWVRSLGKRPSGAVVEFGPRPADAEVAAALGVQPGSIVYYLVRVRLVDDEPLMIERASYPPRVGELLAAVDLDHQSIYEEMARHGVVVSSARHLVSAMPATRADGLLLRVAAHTPLLRVRRQAFSPTGEPLEWSDDRYLSDRVDFAIENTTMSSGVVRRFEPLGGH